MHYRTCVVLVPFALNPADPPSPSGEFPSTFAIFMVANDRFNSRIYSGVETLFFTSAFPMVIAVFYVRV